MYVRGRFARRFYPRRTEYRVEETQSLLTAHVVVRVPSRPAASDIIRTPRMSFIYCF